jgi:hypothetical protein
MEADSKSNRLTLAWAGLEIPAHDIAQQSIDRTTASEDRTAAKEIRSAKAAIFLHWRFPLKWSLSMGPLQTSKRTTGGDAWNRQA